MNPKSSRSNFLIKLLKVLISMAALVFLVHFFVSQPRGLSALSLFGIMLKQNPWLAPLLIMFTMLNWWLEAHKWRILLSDKERITQRTAIKGVLAGITVGLFTPNRVGEYAGRVWFVKHKLFAVAATVVGNLCQLSLTLFMGIWAFINLKPNLHLRFPTDQWLGVLLISVLFIGVLIGLRGNIVSWLKRKNIKWLAEFMAYFQLISIRNLYKAWLISALRYVVFLLPFVVLLSLMYEVNWVQVIWVVPLTYFIQTFIPSFAIAEAGVRTASITMVISELGFDPAPAVVCSLAIWFLNVVGPSLMGLYFIWQVKVEGI